MIIFAYSQFVLSGDKLVGGDMNVELWAGAPDPVWQRTVALAGALCTDSYLYGGHACLACQGAARRLLAGATEDGAPGRQPAGGVILSRGLRPPPHGTSQKASLSHWAQLLSSIRGVRQEEDTAPVEGSPHP